MLRGETIVFDSQQNLDGRGAYLLPKKEVLEKARQIKFWQHAFRMKSENKINYKDLVCLLEELEQALKPVKA